MKRVKKLLMLTGLTGMMCFAVCACQNDKDASGQNPAENQQTEGSGAADDGTVTDGTVTDEPAAQTRKFPSEAEQQQINKALQQMKKDGILDENGQPRPGVDLNDYPDLG